MIFAVFWGSYLMLNSDEEDFVNKWLAVNSANYFLQI